MATKDAKKKGRVVRLDKISMREVTLHRSEESCWIVLSGKVYDVTDYL